VVSDLIEIPSIDIQAGGASIEGEVSAGNSTTTPLGAGGVFTGVAFDITEFAAINVNVASDVASAADGVRVQFSPDGVNWDHSHATTYSGTTGVGYIFNAEFRFARVQYTNGGTAQAYFRLQTIFKKTAVKQSLYTIVQSVSDNMFAELGKNVIIGKTTGGGGGYVAVKVNPSGTMTVEDGTVNTTLAALSAKTAGALVPFAHDEVVNTYIGVTSRIATTVYKLAGVTVATVTYTYDGSNRLVNILRT
jgi:hypothetical protein